MWNSSDLSGKTSALDWRGTFWVHQKICWRFNIPPQQCLECSEQYLLFLEEPILPSTIYVQYLAPSCSESWVTGLSDPQGTWELTWPRAKSSPASMMTTFMPSAPVCCLKSFEPCDHSYALVDALIRCCVWSLIWGQWDSLFSRVANKRARPTSLSCVYPKCVAKNQFKVCILLRSLNSISLPFLNFANPHQRISLDLDWPDLGVQSVDMCLSEAPSYLDTMVNALQDRRASWHTGSLWRLAAVWRF